MFGEDAVFDQKAELCFSKFRKWDESLMDEPQSGRPEVVDEVILTDIIESDPRQTCAEIARQVSVSESIRRNHLHYMGKSKKLDKWVPHKLTEPVASLNNCDFSFVSIEN